MPHVDPDIIKHLRFSLSYISLMCDWYTCDDSLMILEFIGTGQDAKRQIMRFDYYGPHTWLRNPEFRIRL